MRMMEESASVSSLIRSGPIPPPEPGRKRVSFVPVSPLRRLSRSSSGITMTAFSSPFRSMARASCRSSGAKYTACRETSIVCSMVSPV